MEFDLHTIIIALLVTTAAGMATVIGGLIVLLTKSPNPRLLAFGLAFAGGAMVYVSLGEILTKSIASFTLHFNEDLGFIYGTLSFLAGIFLVATIDRLIPNPHERLSMDPKEVKGLSSEYIKRVGLMTAIAITAHNFPEGLATFFTMLEDPEIGASLAVAITLHNIPEGVSIAIPVYFATNNKSLAILACLISGLAEPIGAALGYAIVGPYLSEAVFGGVFGLIAGVMVFLSLDELLPAAKHYSKGHETVYGLVAGMVLMALSLIAFRM
ncbi:zinc transporter ZupT [Alphaproteobacteria bacterium]|nr:zinc transporter ZupT [Alphaproteobacteria bacterium]